MLNDVKFVSDGRHPKFILKKYSTTVIIRKEIKNQAVLMVLPLTFYKETSHHPVAALLL